MNLKQSKKSILIADDEPNIRLLIRRTFEKEYVILEARDGGEVVKLASRYLPDIIILDIMMPVYDGLTALSTLKSNKRTSSIPVIMFTGASHELNEKLAMSLGAQAYLRKPINSTELLDVVKNSFQ